ncbi:hypothetical protein HanIR_Chr09g0429891 [Helianthus annuus]|nr:hypothetical protein HanIR_Chr09g0429891 [Helianthus annuus]
MCSKGCENVKSSFSSKPNDTRLFSSRPLSNLKSPSVSLCKTALSFPFDVLPSHSSCISRLSARLSLSKVSLSTILAALLKDKTLDKWDCDSAGLCPKLIHNELSDDSSSLKTGLFITSPTEKLLVSSKMELLPSLSDPLP